MLWLVCLGMLLLLVLLYCHDSVQLSISELCKLESFFVFLTDIVTAMETLKVEL